MLNPPPPGEYTSLEALMQAVNQHAKSEGYAVVKRRSKKNASGVTSKVYLNCDRGRVYRTEVAPGDRKRWTGTRRRDCSFRATAMMKGGRWTLEVPTGGHDHEGSSTALAHPRHRQMNEATKQSIADLSLAGIKPREIIIYLCLNRY